MVKVEGTFPTSITPDAYDVSLAETPAGIWVANISCDSSLFAVTGQTLWKAVITRSAAITLPASDTRFAAALSSDGVTLKACVYIHPAWRAPTVLTAQQRVVAESLLLAHFTGGFHSLRRTDAASSHLITQTPSAFTWFAVGESVVSSGTFVALPPNNVLPAGTLASNRITHSSCRAGLIAVTWQSSVVESGNNGTGRVPAKLG